MDKFFGNIARMADAQERIAAALETIAELSLDGGSGTGNGAADAAGAAAAPKRRRRTKAEIEAEKAAAGTAPVAPATTPPATPGGFNPAVGGVPGGFPPPPAPAAPVAPAAPAAPAPAPAAPTTPAPAPVQNDDLAAQYAALAPQQQFESLFDLYAKFHTATSVRDALVNSVSALGLGMPLSAPNAPSTAGAAYLALSNEQRWYIYNNALQAAQAVQAAANTPAM